MLVRIIPNDTRKTDCEKTGLYFYNLLARVSRFAPKELWRELYGSARKGLVFPDLPLPREVPNNVVIKARHNRRASLG